MSSKASEHDRRHMLCALALAAKGGWRVAPNPKVGACIVRRAGVHGRSDVVLAEGWHKAYGEAHAEVMAFAALEQDHPEVDRRELTLYLTLEPCAHHGKTPPCVDAVLESGIKRVVIAQRDPNPVVDGRSIDRLAAAGVSLTLGVCESEARRLNAAFNKFMMTSRPLVTAKWAMSLDGRIAARTGDSKWISGEESRRRVHELRGRCDAIVVGVGTAERDDPRLTRRDVPGRDPVRVVIDSKARIPLELGLVRSASERPTMLVTTSAAPRERLRELRSKGMGIIEVPAVGERVDLAAMLDQFGRRRWQHVLVEGGGEILGSLFDLDLVDEVHAFVAPKIIGGAGAPAPTLGEGVTRVADALPLGRLEATPSGDDILLRAWIHEW